MEALQKLKIELPCDAAIPLLGTSLGKEDELEKIHAPQCS